MRQIGTLADERQAQRAGDYLLTLGIRVQVEPSESGFAIWAIDEDRVAQAREELNHFVQNPDDERYLAAEREARKLRDELIRKEKERRRTIVDVRREWAAPRARPLTFLLIVVCCAVAFATDFGEKAQGDVWQKLLIASYDRQGHYFSIFESGSEIRRGTLKLALMVLMIAIVSNMAQYLYSGTGFCGISGVALGLFGYVWMKSEFDRAAGIVIPRSSVTMMLVFVGLCMTGLIGPIANAAHISGLVMGMLLGYGPVVIRGVTRQFLGR